MEKEFVTYEQALTLKELGFDEKCLSRYCAVTEWEELTGEILFQNIDCNLSERFLVKAPLKQQVFRWFREKHECYANLSSWIHEEELGIYHEFEIYKVKQYSHGSIRFKTYEEAENACIDKLIEIVKQQSNDNRNQV
jgi:hypothetical protein